ncbi:MAG: P-II family nitrogen regulator [Clostridiales bacterium]|jgi:nitrogen regulatory protein P-II 1|nr:P-II family nitrogen regulator [Eubacteriales bacterium]MDH7565290.1 P-II family nitrogen regulator [Clostridiales bacterium]
MKKIEAIIRQSKLDEVLDELNRHQIFGVTVTQVQGCGLQGGKTQYYRGNKYTMKLNPKTKLEIVVKDQWVDEIIQAIIKTARTGDIGDGKIFVYSIDESYRIRTGEKGEGALI